MQIVTQSYQSELFKMNFDILIQSDPKIFLSNSKLYWEMLLLLLLLHE